MSGITTIKDIRKSLVKAGYSISVDITIPNVTVTDSNDNPVAYAIFDDLPDGGLYMYSIMEVTTTPHIDDIVAIIVHEAERICDETNR